VERAAEELYGLPLDRFTSERNRLAKELRDAGHGDAAKEVGAYKKPNVPAWAVNQLARREKRAVGQLLKAGADLRSAQETTLASGDRRGLESAVEKERELVTRLTDAAGELLAEVGSASDANREKVRQTLHAAATDPELAERIRAGTIVKDEQPASFGVLAGGSPATGAAKADKDQKARRQKREAELERREAEKELAAAEKALERTRAEAEEVAEELRRRERQVEQARERVDGAAGE